MMSFTIIENKTGPNSVPCGTPLLMSTNFVDTPFTTTLYFRLLKKLIIQLITYWLMFYDPNFLHTISERPNQRLYQNQWNIPNQVSFRIRELILSCRMMLSVTLQVCDLLFLILQRCLTSGEMKGGSLDDPLTLMRGKRSWNIVHNLSFNTLTHSSGWPNPRISDQSHGSNFTSIAILWWSKATKFPTRFTRY